jgi:hypothetical protein
MNKLIMTLLATLMLCGAAVADQIVFLIPNEEGTELVPLSNCKVTFYDERNNPLVSEVTDEGGQIWVRGLESGIYVATLEVAGAQAVAEIEIDMSRAAAYMQAMPAWAS